MHLEGCPCTCACVFYALCVCARAHGGVPMHVCMCVLCYARARTHTHTHTLLCGIVCCVRCAAHLCSLSPTCNCRRAVAHPLPTATAAALTIHHLPHQDDADDAHDACGQQIPRHAQSKQHGGHQCDMAVAHVHKEAACAEHREAPSAAGGHVCGSCAVAHKLTPKWSGRCSLGP